MFYDIFASLCKEKGIAPSTFLEKNGMSKGLLHQWKLGATPAADTLRFMSDYFGVSTDYLLGTDDIKKRSTSEDMELIYKAMQESPAVREYITEFQKLSPAGKRKMIEFLDLLRRAENSKE